MYSLNEFLMTAVTCRMKSLKHLIKMIPIFFKDVPKNLQLSPLSFLKINC